MLTHIWFQIRFSGGHPRRSLRELKNARWQILRNLKGSSPKSKKGRPKATAPFWISSIMSCSIYSERKINPPLARLRAGTIKQCTVRNSMLQHNKILIKGRLWSRIGDFIGRPRWVLCPHASKLSSKSRKLYTGIERKYFENTHLEYFLDSHWDIPLTDKYA